MRCRLTYLIICFVLFSKAQNSVVDSLKLALKNAKNDTTRCNILSAMVEAENDDALWPEYNDELLQLSATKLKTINKDHVLYAFYKKSLASALNNAGFLSHQRGDISKALDNYGKSLAIQEEIGEKNGSATTLNNIGAIYKMQGSIPGALEYYGRSLKIRESIGDQNGIANSLNNIGGIYDDQGDFKMSLEYYSRSLKIRQAIGDQKGIASSLVNIGAIYKNQNEISKALEYYRQSLKIREAIEDKLGIAYSLNSIGGIYFDEGDPDVKSSKEEAVSNGISKALEYFSRSLKLREEIGDEEGIAVSLNNLGTLYLKQKNYAKALEFCTRSMQAGKNLGYAENIKRAAFNLSKIYQSMGEYDLALKNHELYIQMRDSINNEENKKASIKSQLKYEYEKKAAADSVKVAEEKKVVQAQLKQEKTQRYSLYGGLALVIIFSLFMVNRFRVTSKQKKLIEEQKRIVEEQKHLVEEKQREVLDSIHYAKRIQTALITNEHYIFQNLKRLKG